jgi:hypothetical protein
MTKKDEEARKKILARRATFVAAALAGVSTACGKEPGPPPQPCLSVLAPVEDAGPEPGLSPAPPPSRPEEGGVPMPCLKVAAPTEGPKTAPSNVEEDAGPKPPPRPCLKIIPKSTK